MARQRIKNSADDDFEWRTDYRSSRTGWLGPFFGLAVLGGGVMMLYAYAAPYFSTQRPTPSAELSSQPSDVAIEPPFVEKTGVETKVEVPVAPPVSPIATPPLDPSPVSPVQDVTRRDPAVTPAPADKAPSPVTVLNKSTEGREKESVPPPVLSPVLPNENRVPPADAIGSPSTESSRGAEVKETDDPDNSVRRSEASPDGAPEDFRAMRERVLREAFGGRAGR